MQEVLKAASRVHEEMGYKSSFARRPKSYFSSSKTVVMVPTYGKTSTENSSPSFKNCGGFIPAATPAGVPVKIVQPAGRVVPCERKLMIFGTLKIRSLCPVSTLQVIKMMNFTYSTPESCMTLPFFRPRMCSLDGSGISTGDTRTGPIGQAPSNPLLKHHWLWENCFALLETSFEAV